jgi:hypothetical protein
VAAAGAASTLAAAWDTSDKQVLELVAALESRYKEEMDSAVSGFSGILDPVHFVSLDGAWRTLATTLPLKRILPLGSLTMSPPGSHLHLVEATLLNIYQVCVYVCRCVCVSDNYI